jgi:hypothetical protein
MIVEKERTIVQKYKIYSCDHPGCTKSVEDNIGCCGHRPIMDCNFCGKDVCTQHCVLDYDTGDYPILCTCEDPECEKMRQNWLFSYNTNKDE